MDDYKNELVAVKLELADVEADLENLLQHQRQLKNRKHELESIINHKQNDLTKDDKQWDLMDFVWSKELMEKLKSVFGVGCLRPMQLQPMNVTMSGKDCILIMPTGGGKSLCFQLPALLSQGMTLVISPLVSLMEDQLMALERLGIEATMLNASSSKEHVKYVMEAMIDKKATLKLLYVTPEKLAKSKRFMNRLEKMFQLGRFARLVIDEIHCCSQWGHDFRPDYKFLGIMKRQFPGVPILGLTATATLKVLDDVKKILQIPSCHTFRASFNRPNLYYEVREKPTSHKDFLDEVCLLIKKRFPGQSGIVYCFSRKDTHDVTTEFLQRGIKAGCYHADLSAKERSHVHQMWTNNAIQVVVATVAFGMGIDKSNVRFVIHHSLSKSMENLYQESGRAGRDDKKSHCILYYRLGDVFRQSTMVFTEQTGLDNLYGIAAYCIDQSRCRRAMIARHFGEVWDASDCNNMCDHCDVSSKKTTEKRDVTSLCQNVIKILEQAGSTDQRVTAIKLIDSWYGKGHSSLKVKGLDPLSVSRDKAERILVHMLLEGHLKEDFHFTPYSTISYLVPGHKAGALSSGICKVFLEFETKVSGISGNVPKKKKNDSDKPRLSIINQKNSKFSSFTGIDTTNSKSDCLLGKKDNFDPKLEKKDNSNLKLEKKDNSNPKLGKKGNSKLVKRRKPFVCSSDSDSEDLAFGTDEPPAKKTVFSKKKSKTADIQRCLSKTQSQVGNGDHSGATAIHKNKPSKQQTLTDGNEVENPVLICDDDFDSDFST
ncbi:ATP-dependent DNA helicase Q1-like [Gigantopelta aegis]|uniref:ATP-dependent DNA helicase Q1-like n=1 Tax=Gigantopelta aegis TaxID=1735272 RepID=UPI001B889FF8|nr:ATP-dependent DNA helicase Q1-like [Gigantopelta aegis]